MLSTASPALKKEVPAQAPPPRHTFHVADDGLALLDLSGRFLEANEAFCQTCGLTRGELARRRIEDLTPPEDLHGHLKQVHRLRRGETTGYRLATRYTDKDGMQVPVVLVVALVEGAKGEMVQVLGVRKGAER